MKICSRCKIPKDTREFNKSRNRKDGLSNNCKECNKAQLKEHYNRRKAYYMEKNRKRKDQIREYINSKKVACEVCGEDHIACLDFHHERDKTITIAAIQLRMWGLERVKEELSKCKVLCSNCHRKLHWEERNSLVV